MVDIPCLMPRNAIIHKRVIGTLADANVPETHSRINTKVLNILAVAAGLPVRLAFRPTSSKQCNNSCNIFLPF